MTGQEPTPAFRRFPWVQLVFCLTCLATAAWTWMRYSYAWERAVVPQGTKFSLGVPHVWPYQSMCRMQAKIINRVARPAAVENDWIVVGVGQETSLLFTPRGDSSYQPGEVVTVTGRLVASPCSDGAVAHFAIDASASRLRPESTAGLVVGAMGVFIFGLYLRRWLRERRFA